MKRSNVTYILVKDRFNKYLFHLCRFYGVLYRSNKMVWIYMDRVVYSCFPKFIYKSFHTPRTTAIFEIDEYNDYLRNSIKLTEETCYTILDQIKSKGVLARNEKNIG